MWKYFKTHFNDSTTKKDTIFFLLRRFQNFKKYISLIDLALFIAQLLIWVNKDIIIIVKTKNNKEVELQKLLSKVKKLDYHQFFWIQNLKMFLLVFYYY